MFAPQLVSCKKESFGLFLSSYLLHWKQAFDTSTLVEDRSLPIIVVAEAGKRLSGVILGTKFPLSSIPLYEKKSDEKGLLAYHVY